MRKRLSPIQRDLKLTGGTLTAMALGAGVTRSWLSRVASGKVPCGYIVAGKLEKWSRGRLTVRELVSWGRA